MFFLPFILHIAHTRRFFAKILFYCHRSNRSYMRVTFLNNYSKLFEFGARDLRVVARCNLFSFFLYIHQSTGSLNVEDFLFLSVHCLRIVKQRKCLWRRWYGKRALYLFVCLFVLMTHFYGSFGMSWCVCSGFFRLRLLFFSCSFNGVDQRVLML